MKYSTRTALPALLLLLLLSPASLLAGEEASASSAAVDAVSAKLPTALPEEVGLSADRLRRLDSHFQGYIDRKEASGALALIARKGKIAYFQTWGEADRENGVPMTDDTLFRIYSMSKPITSVALMTLYEEGKFFLNDPVEMYLPELTDLEVWTDVKDEETGETRTLKEKAKRKMTVRDLMRHTSGMTYGFFGNTAADQEYRKSGIYMNDENIEETVTKLSKLPLLYEPGTKWHYSIAVDVQGRLVEVLSGMTFDKYLEKRIFEPLGMVDTFFVVPENKRDRFAQLYAPKGTAFGSDAFLAGNTNKEIQPADPMASRGYLGGNYFGGGGGLVSTAADYFRFCQMILNGGELDGQRILSRKTVELMGSNHLTEEQSVFGAAGAGFGLGFQVDFDPAMGGGPGSPGTLSWGGAAGTKFWIDPQEELIGVFMVQILPHSTRMGDDFKVLTYQAIDD